MKGFHRPFLNAFMESTANWLPQTAIMDYAGRHVHLKFVYRMGYLFNDIAMGTSS